MWTSNSDNVKTWLREFNELLSPVLIFIELSNIACTLFSMSIVQPS